VPIYVPICDVLHVSLCVFERTREPGPKRREKETGGRTCRQSLHRLKCTRRHLGMRDCFRLLVDCSVNLSCPLKRTPPCFRSSLPLDLYRRGPLAVRRCAKLRYVNKMSLKRALKREPDSKPGASRETTA
jgi:hypothetical protein